MLVINSLHEAVSFFSLTDNGFIFPSIGHNWIALTLWLPCSWIDEVTNLPALGSSDHERLLLWNFKCYDVPPHSRMTTPMFIYRRGDYRTMNGYFTGMNWAQVLCSSNIKNNWNLFKNLVSPDLFLPLHKKLTHLLLGGQEVCLRQWGTNMLLFVDTGGWSLVLIMQSIKGHSVSNQQGILGHLSDFDETWCVCSIYGAHHPYQLLTTYIT